MTEIVKASLEMAFKKSVSRQTKATIQLIYSFKKGIPAEITFHRATPSNCYKEFCLKQEGILEPIGVDEEKVIRFYTSRI